MAANVREVVLDYIAAGIDPDRVTIVRQSDLPALNELTMLYMNLVTVPRLMRIPTIREEIAQRGFGDGTPAGFLCYPVSQPPEWSRRSCLAGRRAPGGFRPDGRDGADR